MKNQQEFMFSRSAEKETTMIFEKTLDPTDPSNQKYIELRKSMIFEYFCDYCDNHFYLIHYKI